MIYVQFWLLDLLRSIEQLRYHDCMSTANEWSLVCTSSTGFEAELSQSDSGDCTRYVWSHAHEEIVGVK